MTTEPSDCATRSRSFHCSAGSPAASCCAGTWWRRTTPRRAVHSAWTDTRRLQSAIREHVDPGPGLRAKTDKLAERRSWRWYLWDIPLYGLEAFLRGRWHTPALAIPGAALIVVSPATVVFWARRSADAADRWLADPPGPPRDPDRSSPNSGRRQLTNFLVGAGLLVVVLYFVALLTS